MAGWGTALVTTVILAAISMTMALRDAEIQHRNEAVIDPLTGMLNRKALEARTLELEAQSFPLPALEGRIRVRWE